MRVTATLTGTEAVRSKLQAIGRQTGLRALAATAEDAQDYIEGEAAKHNKSGALVRSVYLRRLSPDAFEVGHDLQHAPQALFVHWGTKPHVIRPRAGGTYTSFKDAEGKTVRKGIAKGGRTRQMLRWASGGVFRFARQVNHPGYAGDPWLVRAAAQAPQLFERHVLAQLARITSGA